jgi:hypothetical protein
VPGNRFEDFQFVSFDVETEEIDLSSPNGQQDRIERETLDGYHGRIDAGDSRLLQSFGRPFNVTVARIDTLGLETHLDERIYYV